MTKRINTPRAINRRNQKFWKERCSLFKKQMADDALREAAFVDLADENLRQVPGRSRKSIEKALEDAEKARCHFARQQALKGGKAPKEDALQEMIGNIVRRNSKISWKELLSTLSHIKSGSVIQKIDDKRIYFRGRDKKIKTASIAGLKDRLHRARQKTNSR